MRDREERRCCRSFRDWDGSQSRLDPSYGESARRWLEEEEAGRRREAKAWAVYFGLVALLLLAFRMWFEVAVVGVMAVVTIYIVLFADKGYATPSDPPSPEEDASLGGFVSRLRDWR